MELICPHCGRDRLWYDPYTWNFDCTTSAWRKQPWTTIMMRSSAAMMENPPARSGTEWTISRNSGNCPVQPRCFYFCFSGVLSDSLEHGM